MLVVENFLLLALDPQLGMPALPRRAPRIGNLAAAALLIDLAEAGRLRPHAGKIQADAEFPVTHPLLEQAIEALGTQPLPAAEAIATIARRMRPLAPRVADGLFRRDVL